MTANGPAKRQRQDRLLSGRDRSGTAMALRAALRAASVGFGGVVRARNVLYDRGLLPTTRVDAHVISIGNITAGGTGKTPVALAVAEERRKQGQRVAILTRGYRARASRAGRVLVVSDGEGMRWSREEAGDEPWLMSELAPRVAVLLSPDRVTAARYAIRELGTTTLILDDGFQHRRLARDEDWVLVDAVDPWGYGRLLPRGLLREPLTGLSRATTLVMSRADQAADPEALVRELRRYNANAPLLWATHEPRRLWTWPERTALSLETLANARVLALSGIGNPAAFEQTLRSLGATTVLARRFPDHHPYAWCDIEATNNLVQSEQVAAVVTTEKDAVRLAGMPAPPFPLWVLGVDAVLSAERPSLRALAPSR